MKDLRKLKMEIRSKYPESTFRKVLDAEPDQMTDIEFLSRVPAWLKLSRELDNP
ncbi:MAG: hypothetical protein M1113_00880 [Candidatus Thermoplasmatota archaeon]|jgi:hypothetical protein|nr:hypothetical protein [Candidatus Thermoplasmatota archaeon]